MLGGEPLGSYRHQMTPRKAHIRPGLDRASLCEGCSSAQERDSIDASALAAAGVPDIHTCC